MNQALAWVWKKDDRWDLITNKDMVRPGSIVAVGRPGDVISLYLIHVVLPKNSKWFPSNFVPTLSAYKAVEAPYLRPYFEALFTGEDLSGFFHHVGHFFKHIVSGVGHIVKGVVKHPLKTVIPVAAAALAPAAISEVGTLASGLGQTVASKLPMSVTHALATAGSAIQKVGSIIPPSVAQSASKVGSYVGKSVVADAAANIVGGAMNAPPQQMIAQGAQGLGYTPQEIPQVQQQVMSKVQTYAQTQNVPISVPLQQTLAYVSTHPQAFIDAGYKNAQSAAIDILMKRNGVPPAPDEPVDQIIRGKSENIMRPLLFTGIAVGIIYLVLPSEKKTSEIR